MGLDVTVVGRDGLDGTAVGLDETAAGCEERDGAAVGCALLERAWRDEASDDRDGLDARDGGAVDLDGTGAGCDGLDRTAPGLDEGAVGRDGLGDRTQAPDGGEDARASARVLGGADVANDAGWVWGEVAGVGEEETG